MGPDSADEIREAEQRDDRRNESKQGKNCEHKPHFNTQPDRGYKKTPVLIARGDPAVGTNIERQKANNANPAFCAGNSEQGKQEIGDDDEDRAKQE